MARWKCETCGFEFTAPTKPEGCENCKRNKKQPKGFEEIAAPNVAQAAPMAEYDWKCDKCGYKMSNRSSVPAECPNCAKQNKKGEMQPISDDARYAWESAKYDALDEEARNVPDKSWSKGMLIRWLLDHGVETYDLDGKAIPLDDCVNLIPPQKVDLLEVIVRRLEAEQKEEKKGGNKKKQHG